MTTTFAIAFVVGLGVFGPAIGLGILGANALNAMSRNPQVKKDIVTWMLVLAGLIEAMAIFGLIFGFMLMGKA